MKKSFKTIATFILLIFYFTFGNSSAEEVKEKEQLSEPKKSGQFELIIKRQTTTFTPYEYSFTTNPVYSPQYYPDIYSKLRNNTDIVFPLSLIYTNGKFRYELKYTKIHFSSMNYENTYINRGIIYDRYIQLPDTTRGDLQNNFIYWFEKPERRFEWGVGLGIRNIYKSKENISYNFYFSQEESPNGIQFNYRVLYKITDSLRLNFGYDLYHAIGNRKIHGQYGYNYSAKENSTASYYTIVVPDKNTLVRYSGMEVDLSLSYKINELFSLYIGYNYNRASISYRNYNDKYLSYDSYSNNFYLRDTYSVAKSEIIRGYYLGVSCIF
ncbi:hypothetical protein EHQ90_03595 [Leptospira stimsonii]|uniref:Outer membrane protein beta-barrel domain-containing protein n=1 Tax=Leptospira stimsonii TaxID=2202203 RepID=A0ABY2NB91_9LEPT|nr:hypothetical protein [Leptospira stimsonii]TGM20270.1 hypothetical protein EHQ90_03595 [Leptospira stimsonii]